VPSAYRAFAPLAIKKGFDPSFAAEIERDIYREFEIQAGQQLSSQHILERLSIAQHHGVPTRLIDWTFDLTTAAFFSAFGTNHGDSAVWALNLTSYPFPTNLGRQLPKGAFTLDKIVAYGGGVVASFAQPVSQSITRSATSSGGPLPDGTFVVWKPKRLASRLARQEGLLAWYQSFYDSDVVWNYSEHIRKIEAQSKKDLLAKFIIKAEVLKQMRKDILARGVNEHVLFADLDGLGKRLTREMNDQIAEIAMP
jgi:hypothetical protein